VTIAADADRRRVDWAESSKGDGLTERFFCGATTTPRWVPPADRSLSAGSP